MEAYSNNKRKVQLIAGLVFSLIPSLAMAQSSGTNYLSSILNSFFSTQVGILNFIVESVSVVLALGVCAGVIGYTGYQAWSRWSVGKDSELWSTFRKEVIWLFVVVGLVCPLPNISYTGSSGSSSSASNSPDVSLLTLWPREVGQAGLTLASTATSYLQIPSWQMQSQTNGNCGGSSGSSTSGTGTSSTSSSSGITSWNLITNAPIIKMAELGAGKLTSEMLMESSVYAQSTTTTSTSNSTGNSANFTADTDTCSANCLSSSVAWSFTSAGNDITQLPAAAMNSIGQLQIAIAQQMYMEQNCIIFWQNQIVQSFGVNIFKTIAFVGAEAIDGEIRVLGNIMATVFPFCGALTSDEVRINAIVDAYNLVTGASNSTSGATNSGTAGNAITQLTQIHTSSISLLKAIVPPLLFCSTVSLTYVGCLIYWTINIAIYALLFPVAALLLIAKGTRSSFFGMCRKGIALMLTPMVLAFTYICIFNAFAFLWFGNNQGGSGTSGTGSSPMDAILNILSGGNASIINPMTILSYIILPFAFASGLSKILISVQGILDGVLNAQGMQYIGKDK